MKIAVLGTGMVGNAIGSKLIELGHEVKMGSRTADNEKTQIFVAKHEGKPALYRLTRPIKNIVINVVAVMISPEICCWHVRTNKGPPQR